jgi:hypothetical protein
MLTVSRAGAQRQTRREAVPNCVFGFGPPQLAKSSNETRRDQPSPVQAAPPNASVCHGYSGHTQESLPDPVPEEPLTPDAEPSLPAMEPTLPDPEPPGDEPPGDDPLAPGEEPDWTSEPDPTPD